MPTLRSDDCVSAGRFGDSGDNGREEGEAELALSWRWKNESIEGWNCRLRVCDGRVVVVIVQSRVIPCCWLVVTLSRWKIGVVHEVARMAGLVTTLGWRMGGACFDAKHARRYEKWKWG